MECSKEHPSPINIWELPNPPYRSTKIHRRSNEFHAMHGAPHSEMKPMLLSYLQDTHFVKETVRGESLTGKRARKEEEKI